MANAFRPMLAAAVDDVGKVPAGRYLASYKYDGVRATIINGQAQSRSGKPIPNQMLQAAVAKRPWMEGMDGEFIFGAPNALDVYRATTSAVMTAAGSADNITFYAFDWYIPDVPFSVRYSALAGAIADYDYDEGFARLVLHTMVESKDIHPLEEAALKNGYEGLMLRDPDGLYKNGRSTIRERGLLKLKRFIDFEATITGAEELMVNNNAQEVDELGYAKRSSAKEGLVPGGTLGALQCVTLGGVEFSCGSGFDARTRDDLWGMHQRGELVGQLAKIKSFPIGVKDAPRFPVFLGLRAEIDT